MPRSPQWMDLYHIWFRGSSRGHNQLCKIAKNSKSYIFSSVYQIDMKFDRQLKPATETLWVVSYGGKTFPRWRMAAILKIDISPYLNEQEAQLLLTNHAMLVCKVVEVWQDFLSEYVNKKFTYICYRQLIRYE